MKLDANLGWVLVSRADPTTTTAGGIVVPTKPGGKIERGEVFEGSMAGLEVGQTVLFKGGEAFEFEGQKLIALKSDDIVAMAS